MSVLLIIYASFAGTPPVARSYDVPAAQCRSLANRTRAKVKLGRIWTFCNGART